MPDGYEKHYVYDENQDLVREWDTDARETVNVYDKNHNLLCIKEKISEGQWKETSYEYDEKGRRISSKDALGNVTIRQYEKNGAHPVRIVTPKGEETAYGYDKVCRRMSVSNPYGTVELSYNSRNFVTRRIDGEGYESRWFYDRMGKLASYYPARQWKEQEGSYEYRYDFLERLVETISPLKEHRRVFRNFDGDIVRSLHPVSYETAGENGAGTHYDYDKDGNCIRIHYPDGGTERRFYDAEGNMRKQVLPEAYGRETDDGKGFAYGYDSAGRLTSVQDPEGCLLKQYEYNGHGQVIRETDGEGTETLYRYNGLGLKSREQTSIRREGDVTYYRVISYRYDRQGNKIEETYGKQEVTRDGEPSGWHKIHFAYDGNNHLVEVKDDFGARMRYDYDCLGNPVLEERVIEEGVIQRVCYSYNKNGWRIRKTEEIQGNGDLRTAVTFNILGGRFTPPSDHYSLSTSSNFLHKDLGFSSLIGSVLENGSYWRRTHRRYLF